MLLARGLYSPFQAPFAMVLDASIPNCFVVQKACLFFVGFQLRISPVKTHTLSISTRISPFYGLRRALRGQRPVAALRRPPCDPPLDASRTTLLLPTGNCRRILLYNSHPKTDLDRKLKAQPDRQAPIIIELFFFSSFPSSFSPRKTEKTGNIPVLFCLSIVDHLM